MNEQELLEGLRDLDGPEVPRTVFKDDLHRTLRLELSEGANRQGASALGGVTADMADVSTGSPLAAARPRLGVALTAFLMVVLIGAATWWLAPGTVGDTPVISAPDAPPASTAPHGPETGTTVPQADGGGPVFSRPLPWSLVFDNGTSGVQVVDLSDYRVVARDIEGARGGDQPYRLTIHNGHLVVGWSGIYSHDISSGSSRLLSRATIHVPAVEPSRVWMVDYPGLIGSGPPEVWQVHVAGGQATQPSVLEADGLPAHGIPGGLALESETGVLLWDGEAGAVTGSVGDGLSFVSDVSSDGKLAWCQGTCEVMRVTTLDGGTETMVRHPHAEIAFDARQARFSHDGRHLAAPATDGTVVVVDTVTGTSEVAITMPSDAESPLFVDWAPNALEVFAATWSYGQSNETVVGHYSVTDGTSETAILPHGGTLSFVVVTTDEAGRLAGSETLENPADGGTAASECPVTIPDRLFTPPAPYPSDPAGPGQVWYGSDDLWTVLDSSGGYAQRKSVWWSAAFPGGAIEQEPEIGVTWERLDGTDPVVIVEEPPGTNAHTARDGDFMIAGIDPDIAGCWRVTATYKGATLSYVYHLPGSTFEPSG